ncbi:hypothetical protein PC128_g20767 [Phytophthora cactorum]|nr:hypothetical protein PC128_g20767 [Phytophthora cactorum]
MKMCITRYRHYVRGPAVQNQPWTTKWWKTYEAQLATYMGARKEHLNGLGRLVYKCLDAIHAYWCVFLPDSASLAKDTTVKYWHGFKVELKRIWSRVWFVERASWTDVSLMAYAMFYGVLFLYEIIEGVCFGWPGVVVLTLVMNYPYGENEDVVEIGGISLGHGAVVWSVAY